MFKADLVLDLADSAKKEGDKVRTTSSTREDVEKREDDSLEANSLGSLGSSLIKEG